MVRERVKVVFAGVDVDDVTMSDEENSDVEEGGEEGVVFVSGMSEQHVSSCALLLLPGDGEEGSGKGCGWDWDVQVVLLVTRALVWW